MEVGDEVGVGVEGFGEGEFFAGVFFDGFAGDLLGVVGARWGVGLVFGEEFVVMGEGGLEFGVGGGAIEGEFEEEGDFGFRI